MFNCPTEQQLNHIPKVYETESIPLKDKIVHMHFFIGNCDWYIIEYDQDDLFFGFAILNDDYFNAEFGYISFKDLKEINVRGIEVDNDLHWQPKPIKEIERIQKCLRC